MTTTLRTALSVALGVGLGTSHLSAQTVSNPFPPIPQGSITIELELITGGLGSPNMLTHANDGSGRLFFSDQNGRVGLIPASGGPVETFLDASSLLVNLNAGGDERGLLGLAFHPGFGDPQSPGFNKFYTYTSEPASSGTAHFGVPPFGVGSPNHHSVVSEWTFNPSLPIQVASATRREVLRFAQPQSNHNGGHLAFGPDNLLYIASGDGGASNDVGFGHAPQGNGQYLQTVLGKILRIDPLGSDGANGQYGIPPSNPLVGRNGLDEIYAYGLRNPFRFSFDDLPGGDNRLIVSDVGQAQIEEINIVQLDDNLGWNLKEGSFKFNPSNGTISSDLSGLPAGLVDPAAEYDHSEGSAIIGGYVYRGSAIQELVGRYVFGDFSRSGTGRLFYADLASGDIRELIIGLDDRTLGFRLKGFGQDADGELYALGSVSAGPLGSDGVIMKIVAIPEPAALTALAGLGVVTLLRRRRAHA